MTSSILQNLNEFYGAKLAATDGEIGQVEAFYFDDKTWVVRYLVANTGTWLNGRQVLLSPHVFGHWNPDGRTLAVNLTRKRIEGSPSIELHRPVSRQYEIDHYQYYGLPGYWNGGAMWGLSGYPIVMPPAKKETEAQFDHHHRDNKHLRSTKAVTGYHIQASDGAIGKVSGFMVDEKSWAIHDLVVATGGWYSEKEVLISPGKIEQISYEESKVFVNLTKEDIKKTAANKVARAAG